MIDHLVYFRLSKYPETEYPSIFFAILSTVSPISVVLPSKMMAYVAAQPMLTRCVSRIDRQTDGQTDG